MSIGCNLSLPLCPKCGDTKFVGKGQVMSQKLGTNYRCSVCTIEWSSDPARIMDEDGKVHQFRGGDLPGRNGTVRAPHPVIEWWK